MDEASRASRCVGGRLRRCVGLPSPPLGGGDRRVRPARQCGRRGGPVLPEVRIALHGLSGQQPGASRWPACQAIPAWPRFRKPPISRFSPFPRQRFRRPCATARPRESRRASSGPGGFVEGGEEGAALTGGAGRDLPQDGLRASRAELPRRHRNACPDHRELRLDDALRSTASCRATSRWSARAAGWRRSRTLLAQQQGYGFRYMISTGNEAVLGVADFLRALVDDPETKVIALYLEGVARRRQDPPRACRRARRAQACHSAEGRRDGRQRDCGGRAHRRARRARGACGTRCCASCAADPGGFARGTARSWRCSSAARTSPSFRRAAGVAAITFGGGSGVLSADQCDRAGLAVPRSLRGDAGGARRDRSAAGFDPESGRPHAADLSRSAVAQEFPASAGRDRRRSRDRNGFLPARPDVAWRRGARGNDRSVSRPLSKACPRRLASRDRRGARSVPIRLDAPLSGVFARIRTIGRLAAYAEDLASVGETGGARDIRLGGAVPAVEPERGRHGGSMP